MSQSIPLYVVAVDGSKGAQAASDYAVKLAKTAGGRVLLQHVVDWSDYSFINALEIDERQGMKKREEQEARKNFLEPLAQRLKYAGVEVETDIAFGHPAKTLAQIAQQRGAEMICAGTRGRSDVGSLLFGSFGHGLLQLTKTPVLFLPMN